MAYYANLALNRAKMGVGLRINYNRTTTVFNVLHIVPFCFC